VTFGMYTRGPDETDRSLFASRLCRLYASFRWDPGSASSNGTSRLGISGIALPAIACRSPTIPTVDSM